MRLQSQTTPSDTKPASSIHEELGGGLFTINSLPAILRPPTPPGEDFADAPIDCGGDSFSSLLWAQFWLVCYSLPRGWMVMLPFLLFEKGPSNPFPPKGNS